MIKDSWFIIILVILAIGLMYGIHLWAAYHQ
jgi:hypothetical protein